MALDQVSERRTRKGSGYAQEQTENGVSSSINRKSSNQTQNSRTDRALQSTSSTARTSASKTHIAFNLSFKIAIANRTPFNPAQSC